MLSKALIFIILFTSCASIKKQSNYTEEIADHRTTYKKGFLEDPRSPLTADDLKNLDFYPPDPEWKLSCMCIKADGAKPFELPTYSGITRTYIVHSKVKCLYKDKVLEFNLYKNLTQPANPLYKNYLFLPFKDETNSMDTYGGGRYINLYETNIQNGKIVIDFNKCYNPWCAYSDGYNCPIPPKENHFVLSVLAGEKSYKGIYKHK